MSGSLGSLLNVSKSGLFAQTQAIRVTGANIANVNTTGYTRRVIQLQSSGSSNLEENAYGTGVEVGQVRRSIDQFYNRQYWARISDRAAADVFNEVMGRAEANFSLDGETRTIGTELSEFFSAIADLQLNPSNIPLRQQIIDAGERLVESVRSTFDTLASLQREADSRIKAGVSEINRIAARIAELNTQIVASEVTAQQNLALRDQRDQLLTELSEQISYTTVERDDGAVMVNLANGFTLINGATAATLGYSYNPSFEPAGGYPPGLDGTPLGHIVYNFGDNATPSHIDITQTLAAGGGKIAGLLGVRGTQSITDTSTFDTSGALVASASRVEAIARDLLTRFNLSYLGADEDSVTGGLQPSSFDLDGNSPDVYGLFSFDGASDDDGNGMPDDLDALGLDSYARYIRFNISEPRELAAALDLDPADGATDYATGDGSNLADLLALRDEQVNYSVGNFQAAATIEELYDLTASYVGGQKATAASNLEVYQDREAQLRELRSSVSGVNLDEEFANLISYQRAFEGSARIVRIGDQLMQEILALIG